MNKVATVRDWSRAKKTANGQLNTLFDIQKFLEFFNHYRWVIPQYSEKPEPLTRLNKNDEPFVWEAE